jgi:pimeloyl-ACP methyl ester carboxylesterase
LKLIMRRLRRATLIVVLAIAGLIGALWLNTYIEVRRVTSSFKPAGNFTLVDGVQLHYVGAGEGSAVVLLHGNPGSTQDFDRILLPLTRDRRVIAFDRPGHGYSQRPSGDDAKPSGQARLLHGALQQLGVRRPVFIGHSWGGALALIYVLEYPNDVAGIVLVGTRAFAQPGHDDPLYRLMRTPVLRDVFERTLLLPVGRRIVEQRMAQAYAPDRVPPVELAAAQALWLRPGQVEATVWDTQNLQRELPLYSGRYGEVRVPVAIIVGDHDELATQSFSLHQSIPHSVLTILRGRGHMVLKTRPNTVVDAVRNLTLGPDALPNNGLEPTARGSVRAAAQAAR